MIALLTSALLLQTAASEPETAPPEGEPATAPSPAPRCDTPEYATFDLWLGEWDVYPAGSETKVADSTIERLYNGCAVRENWKPLSGATGGSLSAYNPVSGLWRQTWIGSSPGDVQFVGGPVGESMVISGYWPGALGPGTNPLQRITYMPQPDGSVRQHGEASTDHGLTWATNFDLIYRPKEQDAP